MIEKNRRRVGLFVSSLFVLIHGVLADTIFVNETLVSLRLDTFNDNVLVKGYHRHYIRLKNREKIIITCSKTDAQANGSIMAFVNTKLATQVKCLYYYNDAMGDDNFCQSKQYVAYLEADQSSFVEIWCRLLYDSYQQNANANLLLSRLYEDSEPRIRNGLTLTSLDSTVTHLVNVETISCEATKERSESTFDSLAWFTVDSTFALAPEPSKRYELVFINDQYVNYTSLFPLDSSLLRNNSVYKCCTLFDGKIRSCQRFLAYIYAPPPSTTTTTSTTTKSDFLTSTETVSAAVWNKSHKDRPNFKMFEGIEDRDYDSSGSSSLSANSTNSKQMSDAEIAIIVASVAGTVIIMMIVLLGVLCYRKYRYDQIYLKKEQISDIQSTTPRSRKGQLIPRAELRRPPKVIQNNDDSIRNSDPIRAFGDSPAADDSTSWNQDIRRLQFQQTNNSEPLSMIMAAQETSIRAISTGTGMDRNYERIDGNEAMVGITTTPRLMDAKEQKRREKEMRRLAKLRIQAELKEAKLQAKLAKKQAKRGEPVALGVLHMLQSGDLDIDLYGVPRLQRASIDESKKSIGASLQNREHTNSVTSSSFQQQEALRSSASRELKGKTTSISNLSFVPPPFAAGFSTASPSLLPPPPPSQSQLRTTPNSSSLYSRAVSYPKQENFPMPLRDAITPYHHQPQQISPGVEKDTQQETVYVSPTDNQIELFSSTAGTETSSGKRNKSNGLGNIQNSTLLY